MSKQQTYSMHADGEQLGEQKAATPNRALRAFFGEQLVSSDGRYGRLADGRPVQAYLVHGGRASYPDARTTRTLR